MPAWSQILAETRDSFRGLGRFALRAYSESMPPPWVAIKPYAPEHLLPPAHGERGLAISEYEQSEQLRPGLTRIAAHVLAELDKLRRSGSHQLSKTLLENNPAWPAELAAKEAERRDPLVLCLPLALSRTQDEKGNVPWTLFGGSHLGPARPLWRSFGDDATPLVRLLAFVTGTTATSVDELRAAGVRILPRGDDQGFASWNEPLPRAAGPLVLDLASEPLGAVRTVFTLRAFAELPEAVRQAYLAGTLRLSPSPASLVFFEHPRYRELARELVLAMQIPLLHLFPRSESSTGLRIPQSGWLEERANATEPRSGASPPTPTASAETIRRTHRFERVAREEDQAVRGFEHRITTALFSSDPDDLGLYGKPMARNAQIWSDTYRLILDGPSASTEDFGRATDLIHAGGRYGYRFYYTPMRAGTRWLWWHLPLVARQSESGDVELMPDAPQGLVTAEAIAKPPIELKPVLLARPGHQAASRLHEPRKGYATYTSSHNVRRIFELAEALGAPLAPSLARRLLWINDNAKVEEWIDKLEASGAEPALMRSVRRQLGPPLELALDADGLPSSRTLATTHTREFEEQLWRSIASLAEGEFRDKDNADVVRVNAGRTGGARAQEVGRKPAAQRDIDGLADHLTRLHREAIARHGMTGRAYVGAQVFRWTTDFDFAWSQAWRDNRQGAHERNVMVFIPGKNTREAVVMADHYDTAYMEDLYDRARGGDGLRAAAAGADDNHSATAALLAAADVLLPMAKAGLLERSVLLVHLTGEEFPTDCLGARMLAQALVERTLVVQRDGGGRAELGELLVRGVYVLDMVGHNNDRRHDVFQISPGEGVGSARLAAIAHLANQRWNHSATVWNQAHARHNKGRAQRGHTLPPIAEHPIVRGEIRPEWDRRSALYNTDGQIFSDVGVPVVLFMEDYDIARTGYHDTYDTMENIDLDYAAAVVAIAIESVAEAATAPWSQG